MKYLILTLLFSASVFTFAQGPVEKCGTMEYLQKQKAADPGIEMMMRQYDEQVSQWINQNNSSLTNTGTITIPVVVHIVYNTDSENVSDLRVFEQIAMSNRDFAGLNVHSMGAFSSSLKVFFD